MEKTQNVSLSIETTNCSLCSVRYCYEYKPMMTSCEHGVCSECFYKRVTG